MERIGRVRTGAMIVVPVLVLAAGTFVAARVESDAAVHAGNQTEASQRMLTAMLDQETGARGFFETRDVRFLQPWRKGTADFGLALAESRHLAGAHADLRRGLDEQARRSARWHAPTQAEIATTLTAGIRPPVSAAIAGKARMDAFRAANAAYAGQLRLVRNHALWLASLLAVGLAAALALTFLVVGLVLARRASRGIKERRRNQTDLRELMQVSASGHAARTLVVQHMEKVVPGSAVAVLNADTGADRLDVTVSSGTTLHGLEGAHGTAGSCLAIRLARSYDRRAGSDPPVRCDICGRFEGEVACEPMIVAGQLIGAVLVTRKRPISNALRERARESVAHAAPILANQRNLELAEARASSDALTGLPNRRAADDMLTRMAAQAGRSVSMLAAVLLDIDHFKQINDVHGHQTGDEALVAVSRIVTSTLRASDFAARYGGEEFLLLLPDTNHAGARDVAEKLRRAIEQAEIESAGPITASFGIAILPDDTGHTKQLIREADRALYAAKGNGRNRIEIATPLAGTASGSQEPRHGPGGI